MERCEGRSNCVGASKVLCLELQSLFNDDYDEVIAVEPFFDSCVDQIKLSGGDSWKVTQEHMMQIFKS